VFYLQRECHEDGLEKAISILDAARSLSWKTYWPIPSRKPLCDAMASIRRRCARLSSQRVKVCAHA